MYYVLILLAIVAVIVIGTWLGGLLTSKKVDVDQDSEQAAETMAAWRRRQEDDQIHHAGTPLRCLNCNHVFAGPMPDTGARIEVGIEPDAIHVF